MKIALVSSYAPFIKGGARNIVEWLDAMLREAGHQVEIVNLPELDSVDTLFQQMVAFRWVDLSAADRVVCFRPQAHLVQHPNKILWFIHHIRAFYDLWDIPQYRGCPDDEKHRRFRAALHATDTAALREAQHVFTNSKVMAQRLRHYNGIESEVLYPPVIRPERFYCRTRNDEIVCICRIEDHKRQHLLIQALALTTTPVRLRLCGASAAPAYPETLRADIRRLHLGSRITLESGWISEERKVELLAECLAAAYLPEDEDSYGYPSLEASHARKAILTTTDAGGVLELVTDGDNGLVSAPQPAALAAAMDRLYSDRALAASMGERAQARLDEINISWTHVLNRLLA